MKPFKELPIFVQRRMLECQQEQGHIKNEKIFEYKITASSDEGGFDWNKTIEGFNVWSRAIIRGEYDGVTITETLAFPRVMWVSDNPITENNSGIKRVVLAMDEGKAIAIEDATTLEASRTMNKIYRWLYTKEI